jgi:hypothetical protein
MTVSLIELEARISALEVVLVSHILQSNVADPDFDPRAFAAGRRDAWAAIGAATCQGASDGEEKTLRTPMRRRWSGLVTCW